MPRAFFTVRLPAAVVACVFRVRRKRYEPLRLQRALHGLQAVRKVSFFWRVHLLDRSRSVRNVVPSLPLLLLLLFKRHQLSAVPPVWRELWVRVQPGDDLATQRLVGHQRSAGHALVSQRVALVSRLARPGL